jgi:DNA-binding CsgD family transcriptional regulator
VLYLVYLVIAVGMVILYLAIRPYLSYSFSGRTLQDMIGVVAEETDDGETAPSEAAPVVEAISETPIVPETETLHARRMDILMKHTLTPLTAREYEVVDLIMRGMTRSEIAETMGIKPDTISKHRNAIYSKFVIHKRQELFKLAESLEREWQEEE